MLEVEALGGIKQKLEDAPERTKEQLKSEIAELQRTLDEANRKFKWQKGGAVMKGVVATAAIAALAHATDQKLKEKQKEYEEWVKEIDAWNAEEDAGMIEEVKANSEAGKGEGKK